jgi:hypothetical protein
MYGIPAKQSVAHAQVRDIAEHSASRVVTGALGV